MTFLADESVEASIVARLRADGLDVAYIAEIAPSMSDEDVLAAALANGHILITRDKDFGELVFRQRQQTHGVVLVRIANLPRERRAARVAGEMRAHAGELAGAFTVITARITRIRRIHPDRRASPGEESPP